MQSSVNSLLDGLVNAMGNAYLEMLTSSYPVDYDVAGDDDGDPSPCELHADGVTTTAASLVWNGRATRLNITLSDGSFCESADPSSIMVNDGAETLFDLSLATNDGAVLKAAWN